MKRIIILIALLGLFMHARGQQLTQTVKGTIKDSDSYSPVIGANVFVAGSDPVLGSSTDINGQFKIENVPVGRITLVITSIGYENRVLGNIEVGSAKEVVIETALRESLVQLDEIVVTGKKHKSEVSNEMVQVSGLSVSVEETKRFAGTINDPARMVTSFAGIQGDPAGSNHIVVRGNSPNTVLWRMEGVEIPNPNHVAEGGSGGGAINILNSNMLANSDFYTGAFTADYGNVLGSVFDMKMRTGNHEEREYSVGVGVLGTDITLEGPFSSGSRASYLMNYRYSTLALLDNLGIVDFGGVPKYQDMAFKVNVPTKRAGVFSLFGIGGISRIDEEWTDDVTGDLEGRDKFRTSMGTLNLGHTYFINDNSSFDSYVGIAYNGSEYSFDDLVEETGALRLEYMDELNKSTIRFGTTFNSKINSRNTVRLGVNHQQFHFDFMQGYLDEDDGDLWKTGLWDEGNAGLTRAFGLWKHRFNENLAITSGLNYQKFTLNDEHAIEPRISAKFQVNDQQSVFGGFGMHSQTAALPMYFAVVDDIEGRPNKELEFMKARHFVLGYDWILGKNLYFKTEVFYQQLYDIPVENDSSSSYSIINSATGFTDKALVNEGTGINYGIEFTLERYFSNQYYFLITASGYESNYTALDDLKRKTRFNAGYATNLLFGKEFYLKGNENKVLSFSTRFTYTGGFRFTPILLEESIEAGDGIYDYDNRYGVPGDDFLKWDVSVNYQWNRRRTRQGIKLEIMNVTNHQARTDAYFSSESHDLEYDYQLPLFPVITYTVEF